ncbi:magnesium chelatase subunit D family protein [Nitriliruptor alkaliphilus]|uniref:magnesium chelatase subunit D family protein n=1 Tax=Nitriliruptor alkaliphilus TaxID=427918 RepID=UPI000698FF64|nr:magnesium chelatase subunit D family protein [Nitriliruptor alkaliphilus]
MTYPFSAVVGQDRLTLALLLGAVDPRAGGVLVRGHKGTAKSTAVRGLAALLPAIDGVVGCGLGCDPQQPVELCTPCRDGDRRTERRPTPLVELPVGASEDRVVGAIDLERALTDGVHAFEPGLLAAAHRGILYVDEVNLLGDHLVDVLLDAAASGTHRVEREGVSVVHPARFQLVGTMNPEEGELRPQLLDRFGLSVEVTAPTDPVLRAEVVRRRLAYEADPTAFADAWREADAALAERVVAARAALPATRLSEGWLTRLVEVCAALEVEGLRADIVAARTAIAHAAWHGRPEVTRADVRAACLLALPHRRRRGPFDDPGLDEDELDRLLGDDDPPPPDRPLQEPPADQPTGTDGQARGDGPADGTDRHGDADVPEPVGEPARGDAGPPPAAADGSDGGETAGDTPTDTPTDGEPATDGGAPDAGPASPPPVTGAGPAGRAPRLVLADVGTGGASGRRSPSAGDRGATVRSRPLRPGEQPAAHRLAVAATLRAAAVAGRVGTTPHRNDLRHQVRRGREGNLVVVCLDASGSMGARQRVAAVKGAVRSLLLDAYQRRDLVALVAFRGSGADLLLPPTASVDVADRQLAELPTGGRTPLAAGLERSAQVIATAQRRDPDRRPLLVVVTDGRANDGADALARAHGTAHALAGRGVASIVLDTEDGFVRLGLAGQLAGALSAPCVALDELAAAPIVRIVRAATGRADRGDAA